MKKYNLITSIIIGLSFLFSNTNAQVACKDRLIKNVDFTYNSGGVEPARWNMNQIDPKGFSIDQIAYAYVPTGNFSNQNTDWQNPNTNKNTIRQYAIVRNPQDLNPQYANIPTDGMIIINPKQGENDQFGQFQIANLQPLQTYYVEIKFYNVISLASRGPSNQCYSWCNWNSELNILWEGNGNNAHDGQSAMTWTGSNGSGTNSGGWDGWGNQVSNWMWVSPAGSYATMKGQMTLGSATTGFTFTFLKKDGSATNPIVLGIDYIKIYGCQTEAINVSGGTNSVCEATELTLTAQGLGSAGSPYAWYKNGVLLPGRIKDTLNIVSPLGSGSSVIYRAEGEWSNKSVTLTSKMCCNSVGGTNDEVIRQSFNGLTYTCVSGRSGGYADIPDKNVKNFIEASYLYAGSTCNSLNDGQYAVVQSSFAGDYWRTRPEVKDHTGASGSGALFINAVGGVGQVFYKFNLDGLCNGTMYEFSAWYASLALNAETKPNVEFAVMNGPTKVDYVTTGVIPENSKWYQAAVTFITPSTGNPTYTLQLTNLVTGSSGNDVMIDDIVVKKCTPKIDLYQDGGKDAELVVCADTPIKLKINTKFDLPFIVTGSSGGTVYFQWMEATSPTGPWTLIGIPETSGTYNATPISTSKYYRAKVSKAYATAANGIPPLATDCGNDGMTSVFKLTKGGDLTITVSGNTAYCVADNMSLIGNTGTGVKWGWMKGNDTIPTYGLSNDVSKKTLTRTFASGDEGNYYFVVISTTSCEAKQPVIVTMNPSAVLTLTSDVATTNQMLCGNLAAITTISYTYSGGATGATVTGLPPGVTANVAAGLITINGSPTTNGTFNYTVTTTGQAPCTAQTLNGTIVFNPTALTLTSAAGTENQTVCSSSPAITTITYTYSGNATGATVTGLPTGVTATVAAGGITISGTPTVTGTFDYTVTTTGSVAPCTAQTSNGSIVINPIAVLTLTSDVATNNQTLCGNSAIINITYTYSGGATGATVTGLPAGITANVAAGGITISGTTTETGTFNYTVTTTGQSPCTAQTLTGTIVINPIAVLTLTSATTTTNQTLCGNSAAITNITYTYSGGATGATVTDLPAGVTANVTGGVITISGTPTAIGTFNYTVTTTGHIAPCTAQTLNGTIVVNPIAVLTLTSATTTTNQTFCSNSTPITNITYTYSGSATGASVTGLPAGVTANVAAGVITISGTPTATGTFNWTITTTGHTTPCTAQTANGTITVNPIPTAPTISNSLSFCQSEGTVLLSTLAQTSSGTVNWYSTPIGDTPFPQTSVIRSIVGLYPIYAGVTSAAGCKSALVLVNITINSNPLISNIDQSNVKNIGVTVTGGQSPYSYITGNKTGTFTDFVDLGLLTFGINQIIVTDANNCNTSAIFTINPVQLVPMKFFTPNGDGQNDIWTIENTDFYPKLEVYIYNRYGKELARYIGTEFIGWNGNYNGQPVPADDYWYVITIPETAGREVGHFNLKR